MKVKETRSKLFHSCPPPSSSSSINGTRGGVGVGEGDVLSVLKLLPATIFTLISILCFHDREVLAYMITRSVNAFSNPSSPKKSKSKENNKKKKKKKRLINGAHKPPVFDCDCFDCYTNYWDRWNSSPNRDLIQEAIEGFEEYLNNHEKSRKSGEKANRRHRRKGKISPVIMSPSLPMENVLYPITSSNYKTVVTGSVVAAVEVMVEEEKAVFVDFPVRNHKGFARKVLPDLLGLLNSRFWSLWNPNA